MLRATFYHMTQTPHPVPRITVAEAVELLRPMFGDTLSAETVRRWHRTGRISAVTLPGGRTLHIPAEEIQAILNGERADMVPARRAA